MRRVFLCMLLVLLVVISGCFKSESPESEFQVTSSSEILIYVDVLQVSAVTTEGLVVLDDFEPSTIELVDGLNDFLKDIWASIGDTLYRVKLKTDDATCNIDYVEYPCTISGDTINVMIDPFQLEDLTNVFYEFDITLMKRGGRNPFFMLNPVIQVTSYFINMPPLVPESPSPSDGASEVPTRPTLSWNCEDPDGGELSYDVYLSGPNDSSSLVEIASDLNTNYFDLQTDLLSASTYYWKIVATDSLGASTEGPIWSFNTQDIVVPEGSFLLKFSLAQEETASFQLQEDRELSLIYTDIEEEGISGRFVLADGVNSIQLSKGGTYVLGIAERYNEVINVLGLIGDAELGLHTLPVSYAANDIIDLGNLILNGEVYTSELITGQDLCNILGHSYETLAAFGMFDITLKKFLNPDINRNGMYDREEEPETNWTFAVQTDSKWFNPDDIVFEDVSNPIHLPMEEFVKFGVRYAIGLRNVPCLPTSVETSVPGRLTLPDNLGQIEIPGGEREEGFHWEPFHWETGWGEVWFQLEQVGDMIPPFNGDYVLELGNDYEDVYYFDNFDFLTPDDYLEGFVFALSSATVYPSGQFKTLAWRWYRMLEDGTYVLATPEQVAMTSRHLSFYLCIEETDDALGTGGTWDVGPEYFGYDFTESASIPITSDNFWMYKNVDMYEHYPCNQYDKSNNRYTFMFRADIIGESSNPSPVDGSSDVALQPTLSWETFTDGEILNYTVQIATSIEDFDNTIFFETTTAATSITIPPENELNISPIYYWRVIPSMEDPLHPGETITYAYVSPIWSFSTVYSGNYPPSIPANPDPLDGANNVPLTTSLSWTCDDPENDPVVYDVYFGTSSDANNLSLIAENYGSENFPLSDFVSLNPETVYYWKVVAEDSNGKISEGHIWSFCTVHLGNYPPSIPANADPSDGAYNVSLTTSLSWTCNDLDNDPIMYDVYFGTSSDVNDLSLIAENYGSESYPLSDFESLNPETIYYWKVVAEDSNGGISEGPIWSFSTMIPSEQIFFPDPNLDQVVREYIGKNADEPIYSHEVLWIEDFHAEWRNISNISGIEHLANLRFLYINENNITDISPLASLTKLEYLNIETNNISDISPLSAINSLTGLSMGNNPIVDFSPIEGLSNLQTLALVYLSLTDEDIGFLTSLPQLTELWISRNSITDLSSLQGMVNLSSLFAYDNNITSISPLANMSQLSYLGIWNNRISDLSPLASLTSLIYLNCSDNLVTDISPLSNLVYLQELHISGNIISSIGELSQASILREDMSSFYYPDPYYSASGETEEKQGSLFEIQALEGLVNLRSLSLSSNVISDISPLESLVNLEWVSLYDNEIEDISPLVNNSGIGSGDYVDVDRNYLDLAEGSSDATDIIALAARGVDIRYENQKSIVSSEAYIEFRPCTGEKIKNLSLVFFSDGESFGGDTETSNIDLSFLEPGTWNYIARIDILGIQGTKLYLIEGEVTVPGTCIVDLSSITSYSSITLIDENGVEISPTSLVTMRFFFSDFFETQSQLHYSEAKELYGNFSKIDMIQFVEVGAARHWISEDVSISSSSILSLENCAKINFTSDIDLYETVDIAIGLLNRSRVSDYFNSAIVTAMVMPCESVSYHYGVSKEGSYYYSSLEGLQLSPGQTLDLHVLEGLRVEINEISDDATTITMNPGNQWLTARLKDTSGNLECQIPINVTLYDGYGTTIYHEETWSWDFSFGFYLPEAGDYELVISALLIDFPNSELQNTLLERTLYITVEEVEEIFFIDPNLDQVVREYIGKNSGEPIFANEVLGIEELHAEWRNISNISGMEHLINLRYLYINENNISDISPLASLSKLEYLNIETNNISDISILTQLPNLQGLSTGRNPISNLSVVNQIPSLNSLAVVELNLDDNDILFLGENTNLQTIWLNQNNITDLTPLANNVNLNSLDFSNNLVADLSPLENLTNLTGIWCSGNQISSLEPLQYLTNLTALFAGGNQITDLSPLAPLTQISHLECSTNQIAVISPIEALTNLEWLSLYDNKIEDISPLVNNLGIGSGDFVDVRSNYLDITPGSTDVIRIQTLIDRGVDVQYYPQNSVMEEIFFPDPNLDQVVREYIGKNAYEPIYSDEVLWIEDFHAEWRNISNISGIEHLANLRFLYINENNITDISPLTSLTKLEYLNIETNNISDISSLSAINSLTGLSMGNNPIVDFSPIVSLPNLQSLAIILLSLTDEDIGFLTSLPQLTELWISRNSITDLSPLQGMVNLSSLFAYDNNITNISSLANMSQLSYLGIWNNRISDLSPLASLTSLIYLNCSDNLITDISPLSNLVYLQELHISGNIISSIGELSQASILKEDMSSFYNPDLYYSASGETEEKQGTLFDIQALEGLVNLRSLSLSSNVIADISPLESLVNLEWLSLYDNEIEDISPLVNNLGIGSEDFVDVNRNYLDLTENSADMIAIGELQSRGVNINYQDQKTSISGSYIKFNPGTGEKIRNLNIVFFRENQSTSTGTDNGFLDISGLDIGTWGYMTKVETLSREGVKLYLLEGSVSVPGANIVELSIFTAHADITLIDENGVELSDSSIVAARFFLLDFYDTQSTTSYSEVKKLYGNIPTIAMIHFIEPDNGRHWFTENLTTPSVCSLSLENCSTLNFFSSIDLYEAIDLGIGFNFRSKVSTEYHASDFTIRLMPCDTVGYHYGVCRNGTCYFSNLEGLQLTSGQTLDMHVLEGLHIEIDGIPDDTTAVTMNTGIQWLGARLKDASGCLECQIPVTITLYDANGNVIDQEEIWNWDFGHELSLPEAGNYELVISAHLLDFPGSELQNTYLVRTLQITAEELVEIFFPDPNLDQVVREYIGKNSGEPIYASEVLCIEEFHAEWRNISDISGIEHLSNLRNLYINENSISDISSLSSLTKLEYLNIETNNISDISILTQLQNLWGLSTGRNPIIDLSVVNQIPNLNNLALVGLGLEDSDILFLGDNPNLQMIWLNQNSITDITPLASIVYLNSLDFSYNLVADLSPLQNLSSLTGIWGSGNQITTLAPLQYLTNLSALFVGGNQITDLNPLTSLTQITHLDCSSNQIADISALEALANLQWMSVSNNLVEDILPLVNNTGIDSGDYVDISYNFLDLTPEGTDMTHITILLNRGVDLAYEPQK